MLLTRQQEDVQPEPFFVGHAQMTSVDMGGVSKISDQKKGCWMILVLTRGRGQKKPLNEM